jgi:hypothetical protein
MPRATAACTTACMHARYTSERYTVQTVYLSLLCFEPFVLQQCFPAAGPLGETQLEECFAELCTIDSAITVSVKQVHDSA